VPSFRFAICNEIYQGRPLAQVCRDARALRYTGVELAPHTLAEDATQLTTGERAIIRQQFSDAGVDFVGLHWLLVSPPDLHITSQNPRVRRRSWDYVHRAIQLTADLALTNNDDRTVIVMGSPKQRSTRDGMTSQEGIAIWTEELSRAAPLAEASGVTLLIEPIPSAETNVVNTVAEAVAMVRNVGSPAVQTMFDVHNAADETIPHESLLRTYAPYIRHIHVNESDGQEPGRGTYDFDALLRVLEELQYSGWVSVEAFDFTRPPEEVALRAINRLKSLSAGA
jgi:sugar phosphate isomerase/epimerase